MDCNQSTWAQCWEFLDLCCAHRIPICFRHVSGFGDLHQSSTQPLACFALGGHEANEHKQYWWFHTCYPGQARPVPGTKGPVPGTNCSSPRLKLAARERESVCVCVYCNFAILSRLSLGWGGFILGTNVLQGASERCVCVLCYLFVALYSWLSDSIRQIVLVTLGMSISGMPWGCTVPSDFSHYIQKYILETINFVMGPFSIT